MSRKPNTEVAPATDSVIRNPIGAYLSFLERDMSRHPEQLRPLTEVDLARILALTRDVVASDDDVIPDEVTL